MDGAEEPQHADSTVLTHTHSRMPSLSAPVSRNRSPLPSSEERVDALRISSARTSMQLASSQGPSSAHSLDLDPTRRKGSADFDQHGPKRSQSEESYRPISLDLNMNRPGHDSHREQPIPKQMHEDGGTAEKAGVILVSECSSGAQLAATDEAFLWTGHTQHFRCSTFLSPVFFAKPSLLIIHEIRSCPSSS